MRKKWWLYTFLLFGNIINGQSRFGTILTDSTIYSITSKSNTLYNGIDNYLKIDSRLYKSYDSLLLETNNGLIIYNDAYTIIPLRSGKLRIELCGIKNNIRDTIGYCNFKVNQLPTPKITFSDTCIVRDSLASLNGFLMADSISISFTDDIPGSENWIRVNEFSIGYSYGGCIFEQTSTSNIITNDMKTMVYNYGHGRCFSIKLITHSTPTMFLIKPIYKIAFY
jgi:hypothetical protein